MRPGLRSGNMAERSDQVEDLQQQIEHLNMLLSDRNAHIAELEERQDQVSDRLRANPDPANSREAAIPPAPAVPGNPVINIDVECQRGKVPDLIKNLPNFSGNPRQVNHWITCADRVIRQYDHLIGTNVYELWLMEIRNKIVGEAGDLLASSGTPLEWDKIKTQLKIIYGDKRELSTLLQRLFSLKQNRNTVRNFYTAISDCYTGISTHIQMDSQWRHPDELVKFTDKLCLEKFIDGLDEPYSSHVGILQPTTLCQAYQFANEKANKLARRNCEYDFDDRQNRKVAQTHMYPPSNNPLPSRTFMNIAGNAKTQNSSQIAPNRTSYTSFNQQATFPNRAVQNFSNRPGNFPNRFASRPPNHNQQNQYSNISNRTQQSRFSQKPTNELQNQEVGPQYEDYNDYYDNPEIPYPPEEFQDYPNQNQDPSYNENVDVDVNFQTATVIEKLS